MERKNKTKKPLLETNQNVAGNPNNHNEQSVEGSNAKQQGNSRPSWHSGVLNRVWLTSKSHPGRILASQVLDTPMRMLVRKYPDLAEIVLDQCYKEKKNLGEGIFVDMTFEFIEDSFNYRYC